MSEAPRLYREARSRAVTAEDKAEAVYRMAARSKDECDLALLRGDRAAADVWNTYYVIQLKLAAAHQSAAGDWRALAREGKFKTARAEAHREPSSDREVADLDICECGDYRRDHDGGSGECRMPDDLCHGFKTCAQFRLSKEAKHVQSR